MKRRRIIVWFIVCSLPILCFLAIVYWFFGIGGYIQKLWLRAIMPDPVFITFDPAWRTEVLVDPDPAVMDWRGARWSDDGQRIDVYNATSQFYADRMASVDVENGSWPDEILTFPGGHIPGFMYSLPFSLEKGEYLWAGCPRKNVFFTAKNIGDNNWELRLWEGADLVQSFPARKYYFGLYIHGEKEDPVGLRLEFSNFSPDCRYHTEILSGDIWLLDTVRRTFEPMGFTKSDPVMERIFPGMPMSGPNIYPRWSPAEDALIFGGREDGLVRYDMVFGKRDFLVEPGFLPGGPVGWSPSGDWILISSPKEVGLVSADGRVYGVLGKCTGLVWISWSPVEDKAAFLCHQYDGYQDGVYSNLIEYVIVWDLTDFH